MVRKKDFTIDDNEMETLGSLSLFVSHSKVGRSFTLDL